jgi:hypothetical protein
VRPWFWSGDDTSCMNVAEARIVNDYDMMGDDVWRQLGVGERVCTSTTDPQNPKTWLFAAQQGWMVTQHSLTPQEVAFHISAYQSIDAQVALLLGAAQGVTIQFLVPQRRIHRHSHT